MDKMYVSSPVTHQDAESSIRNTVQVHTIVLATHKVKVAAQHQATQAPNMVVWEEKRPPSPAQTEGRNTACVLLEHTATLKGYKSQDAVAVTYCCITNHPKL